MLDIMDSDHLQIIFCILDHVNFLLVKKEAIGLTRLVENCNSDSLYSRSGCHVVSKAFWMSQNTAAVYILLLKFRDVIC
jgi:hypothetical protein